MATRQGQGMIAKTPNQSPYRLPKDETPPQQKGQFSNQAASQDPVSEPKPRMRGGLLLAFLKK